MSGVRAELALWTFAMRREPDPGVPPSPAKVPERYRYGWEVADEGRRWLGAVESAGSW